LFHRLLHLGSSWRKSGYVLDKERGMSLDFNGKKGKFGDILFFIEFRNSQGNLRGKGAQTGVRILGKGSPWTEARVKATRRKLWKQQMCIRGCKRCGKKGEE